MQHPSFPHRRTVVVSATGCGQSTLAEKLAQRLGPDCIELDALSAMPYSCASLRTCSFSYSRGPALSNACHNIALPKSQLRTFSASCFARHAAFSAAFLASTAACISAAWRASPSFRLRRAAKASSIAVAMAARAAPPHSTPFPEALV